MHIEIVSLFPELIDGAIDFGVLGKARRNGLIELGFCNPRDFATDPHATVDDRPYGGGPGMVMKVEPLRTCLREGRKRLPNGSRVLCLSAQGRPLNHKTVSELAALPGMLLLAGRYEGIDERLIESEIDEELSIGDYVLSGGEFAALVVLDAVTRMLPGVLGDDQSALQDSFVEGLLDCPHYTRPEDVDGLKVPGVLLSGDHEAIRRWRAKQALGRTWVRRPELLEQLNLSDEQRKLLDEFRHEQAAGED